MSRVHIFTRPCRRPNMERRGHLHGSRLVTSRKRSFSRRYNECGHLNMPTASDTMPIVLHKLSIINDRVAEEKDDFDLNLYPTTYQKDTSETSSVKSGAPLSRAPTRTSIVDSLWSRKASTVTNQLDTSPSLQRTSTWRSELSRTDSVVEGAAIEEGEFQGVAVYQPAMSSTANVEFVESEPWSEGLSDFKVDREEDYLSPDF